MKNHKIKEMCGRLVVFSELEDNDTDKRIFSHCADCGKPSKFRITELEDSFVIRWGYCGLCEVGG
jgi:hypothetical protein